MIPVTILGYTFYFTKVEFVTAVILVLIICNCLTIAMGIKLYKILSNKRSNDSRVAFQVMCTVRLWKNPNRTAIVLCVVPKGAIVTLAPDQDIGSGKYVKVNYRGVKGYILRSHMVELPNE